jgi:hypothetical protein
MPQLQKAIPVAAAPLRKFLRVVIVLSLEAGQLSRRPIFQSLSEHIAKAQRIEQSCLKG